MSPSSPRRQNRPKTVNILPHLLTLSNVVCGLLSLLATMEGRYAMAAWLIGLGIVFDASDGRVARLTKSVSNFGKELDSLSDVVTFGCAPALLMYRVFGFAVPGLEERTLHRLAIAGLLLFPCAGAIRLARFNVTPQDGRAFTGLPIPAAAATLGAFTLLALDFPADQYPTAWAVFRAVAMPYAVLLGWLMVSTLRYPKRSLFVVHRHAMTTYLFMFVGLVALFRIAPSAMLFAITITYVSFGVLNKVTRGRVTMPVISEQPPEDQPATI